MDTSHFPRPGAPARAPQAPKPQPTPPAPAARALARPGASAVAYRKPRRTTVARIFPRADLSVADYIARFCELNHLTPQPVELVRVDAF